jgi:hypothetical protein
VSGSELEMVGLMNWQKGRRDVLLRLVDNLRLSVPSRRVGLVVGLERTTAGRRQQQAAKGHSQRVRVIFLFEMANAASQPRPG